MIGARGLLVPVTAGLLLALAGCTAGGSSPGADDGPSSSPSAAAPTPSTSQPVDPNAPAGQCDDADLEVTVRDDPGGAGAGSVGVLIAFENTGAASCELRGYPGVSVLGDGDPPAHLGPPAARAEGLPVETVTLQPGDEVVAPLRAVAIGDDGGPLEGCTVVDGSAWGVYPPHSFVQVVVHVDEAVPACAAGPVWMTLTGPVTAG